MSRNDLSIGEKKNLLKKFDSLVKCTRRMAVAKLGIAQSSSNKLLIEIESAIVKNKNKNRKRKRCGKDEDIEKTLKKWFIEVRDKNVPVNGALLKTKAENLAIKLGRKEFKATDGWLTQWLRRENIVFVSPCGKLNFPHGGIVLSFDYNMPTAIIKVPRCIICSCNLS